MIDAEVLRLRKLRNVALRARALGKCLDAGDVSKESLFAKGSVLCWTIARIATGRLRAHPYQSYQRDHGYIAELTDTAIAAAIAGAARRQNRAVNLFAGHLQTVARVVDDVRSVSLSPDLSDALGRMQGQMRTLMSKLDAQLPAAGSTPVAELRRPLPEIAVEDSWPYLAI